MESLKHLFFLDWGKTQKKLQKTIKRVLRKKPIFFLKAKKTGTFETPGIYIYK